MRTWLQDVRYAWRMFRKNVLSTLLILASLAIGIGANSAIFSVVDALLCARFLIHNQNVWPLSGCIHWQLGFSATGLRRASSLTFKTRTIRSNRSRSRRAALSR